MLSVVLSSCNCLSVKATFGEMSFSFIVVKFDLPNLKVSSGVIYSVLVFYLLFSIFSFFLY